MKDDKHLRKLLLKAGLSNPAVELYLSVERGVSFSEALEKLGFSKSSLYRACDELLSLDLIENVDTEGWKLQLEKKNFTKLIGNLRNEGRKNKRLINLLESYDNALFKSFFRMGEMELLNEEETYERYLQLGGLDWHSMLAYGNWEDLNNEERNMVAVEKKFIDQRMKKGAKAFVVVTKQGEFTEQIVDFSDLDTKERRKTNNFKENIGPYWLNVFEGNDYLHLWFQSRQGELSSMFLESRPVADFHKQLIYSKF